MGRCSGGRINQIDAIQVHEQACCIAGIVQTDLTVSATRYACARTEDDVSSGARCCRSGDAWCAGDTDGAACAINGSTARNRNGSRSTACRATRACFDGDSSACAGRAASAARE